MFNSRLVVAASLCILTASATADRRPITLNNGGVEARGRTGKIAICHHAKSDNLWKVISVSPKSLSKHMRHGDDVIDDGIDCTTDTCDPIGGLVHTPVDSKCDDGIFCNGDESCGPEGCEVVGACPLESLECGHQECDEDNDACVIIPDHSDCGPCSRCSDEGTCEPPNCGACCQSNGSCLNRTTESDCVEFGHTYLGDGTTCESPNNTTCPIGACCVSGDCEDKDGGAFFTKDYCEDGDGYYLGDGVTCADPGTSCEGACCQSNGTCLDRTQASGCVNGGHTYLGNGTTCESPDNTTCTVGACCAFGNCEDKNGGGFLTEDSCERVGGSYLGDGITCLDPNTSCEGACCQSNGTCLDRASETDCVDSGHTYLGNDTTCESPDNTTCPVGACCVFGGCEDRNGGAFFTEASCDDVGGSYHGDGSTCGLACTVTEAAPCDDNDECTEFDEQVIDSCGGAACGECAGAPIVGCERFCGGLAGVPCPDGEACRFDEGTCGFSDLAGVCRTIPFACLAIYDPVCGCDGVTYDYECEAEFAGVQIDLAGPCEPPCAEIFEPCVVDDDCCQDGAPGFVSCDPGGFCTDGD